MEVELYWMQGPVATPVVIKIDLDRLVAPVNTIGDHSWMRGSLVKKYGARRRRGTRCRIGTMRCDRHGRRSCHTSQG